MSWDGIQCCHVLKIVLHQGLTQLPISFINPRWTTAVGIEVANMTAHNTQTHGQRSHLAVRHAIEMSKVSHMLSTTCTDDRSFDLFGEGIVQLKRSITDDNMQRQHEKETSYKKRRGIDDPLPKQDPVGEPNSTARFFDGNLNQNPPPEPETIPNDPIETADQPNYKDPPKSKKQGKNTGGMAKSKYEKAANKKKKQKKCGRCRMPGHFRPDCPETKKV